MSRNFEVPASWKAITWNSPRTLVRVALGVLLGANLVAAGFAFHWWGDSPAALQNRMEETRRQTVAEVSQLNRSRAVASKIGLANSQGGMFLSSYMTPRKGAYSTIVGELNRMAQQAGVKMKDSTFAYEPVEGSASLSQLTFTAGYEAQYPSLLKFVNLLDQSRRFLIIESLQVQPQPGSGILQVLIKLDTFVRDDMEDQL